MRAELGPAARKHPDANFGAYHSGFEAGTTEGPYTKVTRNLGINRLITSMLESGIGPNENVYAELGSTWWLCHAGPGRFSGSVADSQLVAVLSNKGGCG